jgi:hypothetical protein
MDGSIVDIHREHAGKNRKGERHAQLNTESANHGDNL